MRDADESKQLPNGKPKECEIHPEANLALGWIGELYEIDERAGDDLVRKLELRRTESAAVLARLKTWLWSQAILKSLSIGKAAAYTIANWERLTRFVNNVLVPLDNNGTETSFRSAARAATE